MAEYLDQHQGTEQTAPNGYVCSPEETETVRWVEKLFTQARQHRMKYDRKWLDYYRMFRGKQWDDKRPAYKNSEVINLIWQSIQSTVPIMTDARPRVQFVPEEPTDLEFSEVLNQMFESDWNKTDAMTQLLEVILDGHIYGAGISSLEFNPEARFGMGQIEIDSFDPAYFFPDPDARCVNKKCKYVITARPVSIEELKVQYAGNPEAQQKLTHVKGDIQDFQDQARKTDMSGGGGDFWGTVDDSHSERGTPSRGSNGNSKVLVITIWAKPLDLIEEQVDTADESTGAVLSEFVQKKKYPNGRKVVIANKMVIENGPLDYAHQKFPFSVFRNYILPREFWGVSEVEQLESPQKVFNKLLSFALDVLVLMGNPVWVVDSNSGVDTRKLVNKPGLIVTKNPGSNVERREGVQLQPYVLQLIEKMTEWFNQVAGSQDITRGVNPTGVTANAAIENLQQAAQTRIRQKMRQLDSFLQDVGQQYVDVALERYSQPRIFRLVNRDTEALNYFKFHVEHRQQPDGSHQKVGIMRKPVDVPNKPMLWGEAKEFLIAGSFDTKVTTGSSLPFSKSDKEGKLLKFYEAGLIDAEEVLKGTDYPNYQVVLQRVEQQKQMAAQEQAQMAPPQGGQ